MKAIVLVKKGAAASAFETRELSKPMVQARQVLIKVSAFGLNFADVMARRDLYKEAPPLPAVLGYDVAGTIEATGEGVGQFKKGDRVIALTRFGGYAEYAVTNASAVVLIPEGLDTVTATALSTQYCTAVYAATEMVNLHPGDKVLVHSGAGGVGTALIQYALHRQCIIFATAGSAQKITYLKSLGVHHPINYREQNFEAVINTITNKNGVDVIFDAVGGPTVKQGMRLLAPGGRLVCYGAASLTGKNIFGKIKTVLQFGFFHPFMLMMPSKSIIGINLLQIGDHQPQVIERCLKKLMELFAAGIFKPTISKVFTAEDIAAAHDYLEHRESIGKVVVTW